MEDEEPHTPHSPVPKHVQIPRISIDDAKVNVMFDKKTEDGPIPTPSPDTKTFLRDGLKIVFPVFLVVIALVIVLTVQVTSNQNEKIEDLFRLQEGTLALMLATFDVEFSHAFLDTTVLQYQASEMAAVCDVESYDSEACPKAREDFEDFMLNFSSRGKYFQLRYINRTGWEYVRVDHDLSTHESTLLQHSVLQHKGDRYYFQECIAGDPTDVYLSRWDWNVEHGQVQEPKIGTLRIGASVANDEGETLGIVITNFYADTILQNRVLDSERREFHVLDEAGFWIHHPTNDDREMGFMFKDKQIWTFQEQYPELWTDIVSHDSTDIRHVEFGNLLLSYLKFYPLKETNSEGSISADRMYVLATLLQANDVNQNAQSTIAAIAVVAIVIVVISAMAAYFWIRTKWRLQQKEELAARLAQAGGVNFDKLTRSPRQLTYIDVDECLKKAHNLKRAGERLKSEQKEKFNDEDVYPTIHEILIDRIGNAFFMRFCSDLLCPELVMFWRDVITFEDFVIQSLESINELYVVNGSPMQINIGAEMRDQFKTEWRNEPLKDMKNHVEHLLQMNHYNSFRDSKLFEMLVKLKEVNYEPPNSGLHRV